VTGAGFTHLGRLALPALHNEAESGSLALRLASSLPKAPNDRSLRRPLGQLHGARALTMVGTFQPTRFIRLRLTHQETADEEALKFLMRLTVDS
jgi:hypothetical protein